MKQNFVKCSKCGHEIDSENDLFAGNELNDEVLCQSCT